MEPEYVAGRPCPPPVEVLAGRYRISAHLLGRGALADVWAGMDEVRGRPVAVKLFRPGAETAEKRRFAREARTLAGLSHPHLVALYDAGEVEGRAYLVMRQMSGGTLSSMVRAGGPLPVDTVRRIGAQVASALAYIHGRGIVHRDVKPANILLDGSETAVLADFGIARLVDGTQLTTTGVTVGTAAYLSPEQVRGRQVGPAADVYALGLVLLEALTGRREYPGEPIEAAVARLYREPAVPESLPLGLTDLLRMMTADDPMLRPPAGQVQEMLGSDVPAVPSQIRAVAAASPDAATEPMSILARHSHRRQAVWLVPAGLAIAATATVFALRGPSPADGNAPIGHRQAAPSTSSRPASPTPHATVSSAPSAQPSQAATDSSAAPAPQQVTSVASVSTGHALPPASLPPASPIAPPGHAKGHKGGHGHGNGHNAHG